MTNRLAAMAIGGAALALLAACASPTAPAQSESEDAEPSTSAPAASAGAVTITVDGTESAAAWDAPSCTEVGTDMLFSSASSDGGQLLGQIPTDGTTTGLVVNLTLPDDGVEISNWAEATASYDGSVLSFAGTLADDPHTPSVEHDVEIDLSC